MYSKQEIKELTIEFWKKFGQWSDIHPLLRGKKRKWLLHKTKLANFNFRFEANKDNAKVILEMSHRNENRRLKAYETLEKYKVIIEDNVPSPLHWDYLYSRNDSDKDVSVVYAKLSNVSLYNKNTWPDIFDFFIKNMLPLEENFLLIRDNLKSELNS